MNQRRALTVISSWWGACDACSAVGIPVPKILLLDIWPVLWQLSCGKYTRTQSIAQPDLLTV